MPEPKRPRALARHPGQAFCGGKAEQGRAHVHRQQQRRQRRRARVAIGREGDGNARRAQRSEEHTSELQSLMRISYAVFCLKKKKKTKTKIDTNTSMTNKYNKIKHMT